MTNQLTAGEWLALGRVALRNLQFERAIRCAENAEWCLHADTDRNGDDTDE